MSQSGFIIQIAKSRNNILSILKSRGFNVEDYENQSISQVHIMIQHEQLDMIVNHSSLDKKVYVKYHLSKTLRHTTIMEYIDDLFTIESVLTNKDDLIIISKDTANATIEKHLSRVWNQYSYLVNIMSIKSLQFNILDHQLVPSHRILNDDESQQIRLKYNIMNDTQIPDISRFSPVAIAIGIRPGELCEIIRPSKTSISSLFYRICSQS